MITNNGGYYSPVLILLFVSLASMENAMAEIFSLGEEVSIHRNSWYQFEGRLKIQFQYQFSEFAEIDLSFAKINEFCQKVLG